MSRLLFQRGSDPHRRWAHVSDPDLIAACLSGDASAWDALIRRYEALIFSIGTRSGLSQTDAEDIFQDVCLLLLRHLEDLRDTERLAGWLGATTRREVWRLRRRRGATLTAEMPEREWELETARPVGSEPGETPQETLLALEDQNLVHLGLQELQDRCRTLLTLLYLEDPPLSYAEISERLSLPVGSIGPTRARCLQQLQKILENMGF